MTTMTKVFLIATCVVVLLMYLIHTSSQPRRYIFSSDTMASCEYGASITKKAFVGTEFEDFDFYQSCLDNIKYANPINRWIE